MSSPTAVFRDFSARRAPSRLGSRLGANRLNPLLTIILAFWALWHCRHARPPDTPLVTR